MFPLSNGETVTRLRRQLVHDPYSGEETLGDWSNPNELPIEGCAVAPSSSSETRSEDRTLIITGISLYCPPGADVKEHDRIRANSGVWEVQGEAAEWSNPFTGWRPLDEHRIERVTG